MSKAMKGLVGGAVKGSAEHRKSLFISHFGVSYCGSGKSVEMLGESLLGLAYGFTVCRCQLLSSQRLAASLVQRYCRRCGKNPTGKASGLAWTMGRGAFAYISGPHRERFFFLIWKEPVALTQIVPFESFVSAETLVACVQTRLHPKKKSHDQTATLSHGQKSEGTSSSEQWEHNVESLALSAMVQDQPGEQMSPFLEDWELARVALSSHIALDLLCQMHEAR